MAPEIQCKRSPKLVSSLRQMRSPVTYYVISFCILGSFSISIDAFQVFRADNKKIEEEVVEFVAASKIALSTYFGWSKKYLEELSICGLSSESKVFFCRQVLEQPPYNLRLKRNKFVDNKCKKRDIAFHEGSADNLTKKDKRIKMFKCPPIVEAAECTYFVSRGKRETDAFVYVRARKRAKIIPDALVRDINLAKIERLEMDSAASEGELSQGAGSGSSLADDAAITPDIVKAYFNISYDYNTVDKYLRLFLESRIDSDEIPYTIFKRVFGKLNVCSLSARQKLFLCSHFFHNESYGVKLKTNSVGELDCRERKIRVGRSRHPKPVNMFQCPVVTVYDASRNRYVDVPEDFFFSSTQHWRSATLYSRNYRDFAITPTAFVYNIDVEMLQFVRESEKWRNSNTEDGERNLRAFRKLVFGNDDD